MILNKVKLYDFISHHSSELDLGFGINVVVGPNGAGKTSILDAISFALFNDYTGRGRKENLINSKATKCKAAVEFTENGVKYAAEWSMEKNRPARGSLYRLQNDSKFLMVQGGGSSVVPEIEKILGIDRSMFVQSIYVRQGEIEELVMAKPADRKALISRLLGVDDLEKAWNGIRFIIAEFEGTSRELKGQLDQRAAIEAERQAYSDAGRQFETQIQSKIAALGKLDSQIRDLRAVLDKLTEVKKSFDELDRQRSVVESETKMNRVNLNEKRSALQEAIAAEERVKGLEAEVGKLQTLENYVMAVSQKREYETRYHMLAERIQSRKNSEKTLEENEDGHELYLDRDKLLKDEMNKRKSLEGIVGALQAVSRNVQQAEKDEQKKRSELVRELAKWSKTLQEEVNTDNFEDLLEHKKDELQIAIDEQHRTLNEANSRIGGLKSALLEIDATISKFGEIGVKPAICPTCGTELAADRVSKLLDHFCAEKIRLEADLKRGIDELDGISERKDEVEQRFRKVDQLDPEKISSLRADLGESSRRFGDLSREVAQLEERACELKALDDRLRALESEKAEVSEAFQEYEFTKRELAKLPSHGEMEAEMAPISEALAVASGRANEAVSSLGYEPKEPEKELISLRLKKQDYDRNTWMANRRTGFEADVKTIEKSLKESEDRLAGIEAAIRDLSYDENEHSGKQQEVEDKNALKNELENALARLDAQRENAEKEVEICSKKLKELRSKEKEKKAIDGFIGLLNRIRVAYGKDGVQKMIRATARPLLERASRDLFERFNLAYSDIKIDDDYNISVIGSAGEQDIDQISGGERVALAIALRLAIAQVLSGRVETIIMDEPTTHLDEERRKELVNILSSFFREGGRIIPQMLIITHHREIEDVADVVYAVRKEGGYSIAEIGKNL